MQKKEYKIDSVNPLYLLIYKIDSFIEEKGGNKYLNIAFTDNNDEVFRKYKEVLGGINNKSGEHENDGKYYPQAFLDDCLYEL